MNRKNGIDLCVHWIDRRVHLNLFKATQSAAGLKALKPAVNRSYLMWKSSPYYFHLLYRSTFILLSAKYMLGLFVFRNPPNSDINYTIFNEIILVRVYRPTHGEGGGGGGAHRQPVSGTCLTRKTLTHCAPDRIRTSVLWILSPTPIEQTPCSV